MAIKKIHNMKLLSCICRELPLCPIFSHQCNQFMLSNIQLCYLDQKSQPLSLCLSFRAERGCICDSESEELLPHQESRAEESTTFWPAAGRSIYSSLHDSLWFCPVSITAITLCTPRLTCRVRFQL